MNLSNSNSSSVTSDLILPLHATYLIFVDTFFFYVCYEILEWHSLSFIHGASSFTISRKLRSMEISFNGMAYEHLNHIFYFILSHAKHYIKKRVAGLAPR